MWIHVDPATGAEIPADPQQDLLLENLTTLETWRAPETGELLVVMRTQNYLGGADVYTAYAREADYCERATG